MSYFKAYAGMKRHTPEQLLEMAECAAYLRRLRRGGALSGTQCVVLCSDPA